MEDRELLRQFVRQNSQAAFSEVVRRHTDWLYAVCRRRIGDASLAEDATQAVFLALARKAPSLTHHKSLSPWLFQAAKFAANNIPRAAAILVLAVPAILVIAQGDTATGAAPSDPDDIKPITLTVRATIDGSDVLTITPSGAAWTHIAFDPPNGFSINGQTFSTHAKPSLYKIGLADADLSSARVSERSGRGTVALEKTDAGIAIHFADPEPSNSPYMIRITFAPRSAAPTTRPAPPPPDKSILLDIKATIAGCDILTINPQGAQWRHTDFRWPSNVAINDQSWDVQAQPALDNIGLTDADLSSANVVDHTGRDTVVMEKTDDGLAIYFADAVGGPGDYEIKIRFPLTK